MGEIGIPRREFLYDIQYWEVQRIIRGYRRRNFLTYQLLAENIFATIHVMRDSKGKTVKSFFPDLFDNEGDEMPDVSEEDIAELKAEMANATWIKGD